MLTSQRQDERDESASPRVGLKRRGTWVLELGRLPSFGGLKSDEYSQAAFNPAVLKHLTTLDHSSTCEDKLCFVEGCSKMKSFTLHFLACQSEEERCVLCRRMLALLNVHSSSCAKVLGTCSVPYCFQFRLCGGIPESSRRCRKVSHSTKVDRENEADTSKEGQNWLGKKRPVPSSDHDDLPLPAPPPVVPRTTNSHIASPSSSDSHGVRRSKARKLSVDTKVGPSILQSDTLLRLSMPNSACPTQRLVLLQHAGICEASKGRCNETAFCDLMKATLEHVRQCALPNCDNTLCVSSKLALSHFLECKNQTCRTCGPARSMSFARAVHIWQCSTCSGIDDNNSNDNN